MSRAIAFGWALGLVAACAPADPGWSSEHPSNPAAPIGGEAPVAAVLREEPAPPPTAGGMHHHHHGSESPEPEEDHDAM